MPNKVAILIISTLAVFLLALGGIAFLLWKGKKEGRPIFKIRKSQLEIPLGDEAGSTVDLSGGSANARRYGVEGEVEGRIDVKANLTGYGLAACRLVSEPRT